MLQVLETSLLTGYHPPESMATLTPSRVHQGFWVDQTQGRILGATITTTAFNAQVVIALLSVLITVAGSHLWDLVAFACFWTGCAHTYRRGFHHQCRILLRNITSPGAFFVDASKVAFVWRKCSLAMAIAAIGALLCSAGFLAASLGVSFVVQSSGVQVLADSGTCGWLSWRNESTTRNQQYQQTVYTQALDYLGACYNKTENLARCNTYAKQALHIANVSYVQCPFPGMCTNHSAIRIDTGLLDSNIDFGINTGPPARVLLQKILTCAPLATHRFFTEHAMPANFSREFYGREPFTDEQQYEWFLGSMTNDLAKLKSTIRGSNYTRNISNVPDLT
jgi:hypothetical protein